MYCNKCGIYLPDDADFCPSCGTRTGKSVHAVPVQTAPVSRGKNSIVIAAIAAVTIVLVVCIVCFAVFTYSGQKTQLASVQTSQQTADTNEKTQDDTDEPDSSTAAQQATSSTESTDTADTQETDDSAVTTVTNNYYYYGSGAARDNNYYTSSSSSGFLWPTDKQYISTSDLRGLSQDTVAAIRNEIYARHGYAFTTERWQNYFAAKTWYQRDSTCTESTIKARLSSIERANISTIVAYEESMGWRNG